LAFWQLPAGLTKMLPMTMMEFMEKVNKRRLLQTAQQTPAHSIKIILARCKPQTMLKYLLT
jgi:hypothetical protein